MLKAATQRTRQLAPGDKLGKYEVIRQIAIGGMAELYLTRTVGIEGFEKLVVLKRILPQFVSNAKFVSMFLNEARIAATLHHPNVAQVYDIGVDEGEYFFAMEYVHGEDLEHISVASEEQGVPISMDASLTLIAGLCAGLHYAHDKATADGKPLQIVHRDVSPSNVLVSYDGAVKLVDFGIARASSHSGTTGNSHGGLKGKISYMSPEQCTANAKLDRRSDIYAVGTLLYQLTTGQLPFSGETEYQVLNQIVNEDVPPPTRIVPSYPPALERIVLRAVARNPQQRYSTALELQGAVEDFAHDTRLRVSPLVLARLMGTLFPERLEEWDHAKAQGAFFVEQHVVRTLIESGKTPDRTDPAIIAALAAAQARERAAELAERGSDDDDTTAINPPLDDFLTTLTPSFTDRSGDTNPGSLPLHTKTRGNTAGEGSFASHAALPHLLASAGTLVSPTTPQRGIPIVDPAAGALDVTEHVRIGKRRMPSPTTLVHTGGSSSRKPLLVVLGGLALAGGIAAVIALRGEQQQLAPAAASQPVVEAPSAVETMPATGPTDPVSNESEAPTKVEAPAEVAASPQPIEANVAPQVEANPPSVEAKVAPVEPKPTAKAVPTKVVAKKPATKVVKSEPKPAKPAPKPAPKSAPTKEGTWNADSPFMPVRTGK